MPLHLLAAALFSLAVLPVRAQSAGDVAVVGYRADDPDEFALVALAPIAGGTEIAFTDNGWQASGSFRSNEGTFRYTVPAAGLAAGTVVPLSGFTGPQFSASGDQILVYVGSDSSPTFLYALNVEGSEWQADATSSNTSALPSGLANGATAVALPELDNYAYTGPTEGTRSELLSAISDPSNWTGSDDDRPGFPTSFTVTGAGGNIAPSFTNALTSADAFVGVAFSFDYDAVDPEGAPLTFALDAGPDGATLDAATGILTWTPPESAAGQTVAVTVSVTDGETTATTTGSVTVYTEPYNQRPWFEAPTYGLVVNGGSVATLDYNAVDYEGGPVTYALASAPAGTSATVDAETGVFSWTTPTAPGVYPFVVTATDPEGLSDRVDLFVGVQGMLFPDLRLADLRAALRTKYTGTTLGYDRGRDTLYAKVEAFPGVLVHGVYTGYTVALDTAGTPRPDPSAYLDARGINAEHTWPQSMGADSEPQRSDMHILYAAKANVNSSRGNSPYGEVPDDQTQVWYAMEHASTTIPTTLIDEWSERGPVYFEPRERVKGDIARALLYFATIYETAASPSFLATERPVMLAWDGLDPTAPEEVVRSGLIERYQGNVNPFVLDPTLARRAFDEAYTAAEDGPDGTLAVSVYPNPTAGRATVSVSVGAPGRVSVEVFDALGRRVSTSAVTLATGTTELALDLGALPAGAYVIRTTSGTGLTSARLTLVR